MAFHLEGPWLSTVGKRKGKQKFRTAEEARKARELEESWKSLQQKWNNEKPMTKSATSLIRQAPKPYVRQTPKIPSLNNGVDSGVAALKPTPVYTGDQVLGVAVMHKSCLQPIFNEQAAKDSASMRR